MPPTGKPQQLAQDQYALNGDTVTQLHDAGVAPWLLDGVAALARHDPGMLAAVLTEAAPHVQLPGTNATCRCHILTTSPNGRLRVDALAEKLARQAQDYCIPRSRIAEAAREYERNKTTAGFSALEREARELFAKLEKSGEGGELLLYLLLESVLGLPQLLCKMPLKTSSEMHVHGVDGVHGKLLANGNLALYWGESKVYARVNDGIDECFQSLARYLLQDESGPARRDLLLVRDHIDPGDEQIRQALVKYFDETQPESARVEFRGACLVGFKLEDYPDHRGDGAATLSKEITAQISKWQQRIKARVGTHQLESFELEIFCVPFPSVEDFRAKLRDKLGLK
jgi:hypothetical protein